jgi:hypothetical protein
MEFDSQAFHTDVEKSNGVPVVLARWGFRKVSLNGKIYLMAMTKEECDAFKRNPAGLKLENLVSSDPEAAGYCVSECNIGPCCTPVQGCRRCIVINNQFGWTCECSA